MASSELGKAFEGVSPAYPSASSSKQPWDVFINHCGSDVKHTFAASIFNTLHRTGLRVFLDVEAIEGGDVIPTEIEEAMCSACVHIAIFSANYASSPWCLAELSFMLKTETKIIPVFYHVDPSDLRWVAQGKGCYVSAFAYYEEKARYTSGKLKEWKMALENISMHSGLVVKNNYDEGKVLKDIENQVLKAMKKVPFEVAKHPVGLDCMVQELERYTLQSAQSKSNVQIVGIVGVEGIGKTTLAKELYNQKCSLFQNSSFIFYLRDAASKSAIHKKQKKLLKDIGVKTQDLIFDNIEEGKAILTSRLRSLSVLIVLDDIDHEDQLDALLPASAKDRLGSGSLIIVTSRVLGVLTKWGISSNAIYKMKGLDESDAQQLLCQHAFLQPNPKEGFEDLVRKYLIECKGLPLFLKKCGEEVYKKSRETKLKGIISISSHRREETNDALCNSIQIEEENQIVWLDQLTGKINLKTSARSLTITHGNDNTYWPWVSTEESSFGQVKESVGVWFFKVYKRIECKLLSPNTEYTVAFVVKIDRSKMDSYQSPFEFSLQTIEGNLISSARFLDDLEKPVESHGGFEMTPVKYGENGWMEFVVGEFFLKEDDVRGQARVVDVFMKNENCNFQKSGIFLDGVKITPKTINKSEEQVYKKSMEERSAQIMGNDAPRSKAAKSANSYANASEIEWARKLPPNYHKILSRAVKQEEYSSMEEIYFALCNSIQIEKGKQVVWLDKSTGKIGMKASARSLTITHGNENKYWRWVSTEDSSFTESVGVWYFMVYKRLECMLLSPNTEYTVAFVVKIDQSKMDSYQSPFEFSLQTTEGNLIQSARFLDDLEKPVERHGVFNMTPVKYGENGWMEFVVGEFFLKEEDGRGQARVVDVFMKNENTNFQKSGIFLDGVKITPKTINKSGEQVYKKSMEERSTQIMRNDCLRSKAGKSENSYANASDIEWAKKLPANYHKILSRAVIQKDYSSMKKIYDALCNSIQIENGKQSVWLDKSTSKICLKASARSLTITLGNDNKYWQWVSTEESSFGQVKESVGVWFFNVYKRVECMLLSPNTEYTVAFVVKIDQSKMDSYQSPFEFSLQTTEGNMIQSARFLDDLEKPVESHGVFNMTTVKYGENGWMEFVVGEFFLKEDDGRGQARVVDVFMKNENTNFQKSGIFLDGVKITPKTINKPGEQVYKKSMEERSTQIMRNDCPRSKAGKSANSYANASDIEWAKKLPANYHKILSRAVIQKDYSSMKKIYDALCNSIQIENGKQSVWLDKSTSKICLKASARSLTITLGNDNKYWQWVSTEESSFGQVKESVGVWFFHVYKRVECTLLSSNTEYTVAFVVKIDQSKMNSYQSPFEFSLLTIEGNLINSARFLDDLEKQVESHGGFEMTRVKYGENGWMEFVAGEFFLKEDDGSGKARVVDVFMKNENCNFQKSGIFLDGVKITPK